MDNGMYYAEYFHCPKNPLFSACLSLPFPFPWATTGLSSVSIVLPFPRYRIVGIIQYVAFPDDCSFSNMHLSFYFTHP